MVLKDMKNYHLLVQRENENNNILISQNMEWQRKNDIL
jgi:hypothetical protein